MISVLDVISFLLALFYLAFFVFLALKIIFFLAVQNKRVS